MTRKEALEYVNNMWMYEDTKNALETLIPEFGKAGKVIDHEDKYKEALLEARALLEPCLKYSKGKVREALDSIDKELKRFESEDERIRMALIKLMTVAGESYVMSATGFEKERLLAYLEKQKENPKSADSIPSDCASDAKCEDRWHKVSDSLPDNGRLVLANDCLGNTLLARYDGEGNWEVSVYDNEDYYCRNTVTKWCEIPSEKQKEQKPEWNEEDEKMLDSIIRVVCGVGVQPNGLREKQVSWLKALRPQSKDEIYKEKDEAFKLGKHQLAIKFMNYLDENRPEGKMSLSNGECEDINKAFKENDWPKIMRYVEKYSSQPKQEWSEEDEHNLNSVISLVHSTSDGAWGSCVGDRIENWLKFLPERFSY